MDGQDQGKICRAAAQINAKPVFHTTALQNLAVDHRIDRGKDFIGDGRILSCPLFIKLFIRF
jgi:hypothetical protein